MDNVQYIYSDLKITNDTLELDAGNQPVFIYDADVIIQDIRHAIRESGLIELLIAERNQKNRELVFNKLKMLVEEDERIEAGSTAIKLIEIDSILITAVSDFGDISIKAAI